MSRRGIYASGVRLVLFCVLTVSLSSPSRAESVVVAFPDDGVFSVWVRSEQGAVAIMPFTSRGHGAISLPIHPDAGQTLFVLDAKTGRVASAPIHVDPGADAAPIALLVSDFQLLSPSDGALPHVESHPVVAPLESAGDTTPPSVSSGPPVPARDEEEWETPVGTFLMGVALMGVCCGIFLKVMRRSQPSYESSAVTEAALRSEPAAPSAPKSRQNYRVAKSAGRGSRRRVRAHTPHLVGTDGLATGAKFALSAPIVSIGRDGDNGIVLAETKVSRRHARIEHSQSGAVMLIDEASANGVYVNGMRVEKAALHQGDEIKIGDSYFRYEE